MKVLLVTGSYPPDVCGTAGYTARLSEALCHIGVDAHVFYRKCWGLRQTGQLLREIDSLRPDLIHLQYPTTGYGYGLAPQAISMIRPTVITFHEASQAHPIRQLSYFPFLLRGTHFVFTNAFERGYVTRFAPWIGRCSTVVPIGCNIPVVSTQTKFANKVTCFSIIRPDKGLEEVVKMARCFVDLQSTARVCIVGALMPRWASYFARLRQSASELPVDWEIGVNDASLSRILAQSSVAYLPFPDGASERRSSLIAMLMNQACVLTSIGKHTPADLKASVVPVSSSEEAARQALHLLRDAEKRDHILRAAKIYSQRFSWSAIAAEHARIYTQQLHKQYIKEA